MDTGHFYFLKDEYFIDFPDEKLMKNKESINGVAHNRPCFFSFFDDKTQIYWMIPCSSQVEKFKTLYQNKIIRYGKCNTIVFGEILGHEKVFLIQNMCPITPDYVMNIYIDKNDNIPVKIDGVFEKKLIKKAKDVLTLHKRGIKLIFPDVLKIEKSLIDKLKISI